MYLVTMMLVTTQSNFVNAQRHPLSFCGVCAFHTKPWKPCVNWAGKEGLSFYSATQQSLLAIVVKVIVLLR